MLLPKWICGLGIVRRGQYNIEAFALQVQADMSDPSASSEVSSQTEQPLGERLLELIQLFGKLGIIGFGGPQAHMAMQHDEAVVRRGWLSEAQFSEGIALCEMLPGPASTQMGIYIGYLRAQQLGALIAGFAFILPAYGIVLALAWAYFQFQNVPQLNGLFFGILPVVIAIILAFCWKLGRKTIKEWTRGAIAVMVLSLTLWLGRVLLWFGVAALIGLWLYGPRGPRSKASTPSPATKPNPQGLIFPFLPVGVLNSGANRSPSSWLSTLPLIATTIPSETLALSSFWGVERIESFFWPLLLFFLKVGSVIYGGGLVIIPFISGEVVDRLGWLSSEEFLNGVAIGQLSPGPVVLTAAFIGYKVAGVLGSLVATVAIFAPSFAFIMLAAPALLRIRRNPWIQGALQGVTPAALGAITAAAIPLSQNAIVQDTLWQSGIALGIAVAALVALLKFQTPTWQLVPAGAVLGLLLSFLNF